MKAGLACVAVVFTAALAACAAPGEAENEDVESQSDAVRGSRGNAEALRLFDRAKAESSKAASVSSRCRSYGTSTKVTISTFTLPDGTALVDLHVQRPDAPTSMADTVVRGMPWLPTVDGDGSDFGVDFVVGGAKYQLRSAAVGLLSTPEGVIELRCDSVP